jgi:RNA polymerase sigma-70 factor (ECF subfamily)
MLTRIAEERLTEWFHWFRRWRAPLRKYLNIRLSVGASDLDDVAQEVFLRLLRYNNMELIQHPQAYLFKMAANVAGEWAMRSRHRYLYDASWLDDLRAESDPEHEVAREATHQQLRRALADLPPRQREVLRLLYGEGFTRALIAERLNISERIVKRDLTNAYCRLRTALGDEVAIQTMVRSGG